MRTLRNQNQKATSLTLRENNPNFNYKSSISVYDTFQSKQQNTFQDTPLILMSLQEEMFKIFKKQFETFKGLLKQHKQEKELNLKQDNPLNSQKQQQCNNGINKSHQSLSLVSWNGQQVQNKNANEFNHESLSFILSKTSHQATKIKSKENILINTKEAQMIESEQSQLVFQQKKFMRSTGFIKHSKNYNDFEKMFNSPQKIPLSTYQVNDIHIKHQEQIQKNDQKGIIYNKLIFVREH